MRTATHIGLYIRPSKFAMSLSAVSLLSQDVFSIYRIKPFSTISIVSVSGVRIYADYRVKNQLLMLQVVYMAVLCSVMYRSES